jgi:hypothetical protein
MAKQKRGLPSRKPRDRSRDDESLLLRSAESLGRVIGSLQRQLDGATRRLSATASETWDAIPSLPGGEHATRRGTKKRSAASKRAGAKKTKSAARKTTKAAARKKTRKQ